MVKQYIYIILLLISISSYAQPPIITNIAASPNAVCPGQQSSTITVNASGNITGYLWSNSMSGNPITVSPTATTTYTVTVTGSGGTASASVMVNVHPVPSVTFLVTPSSNCASNVQFSFTGTSQGNSTYLWNFSDNGSSTLQNPVHTYTNAYGSGTQTVSATLTVTNMYGCTASSTQSFTVNQIPDANLFDVDNISPFSNCDNSPTTQDPNFYIELNNANQSYANSYLVNWGDGNSATYTNSDFPINHTYTQLGAFNLTATATGANLCTNTFSHVVANQSSPNVGIGANLENNNLCWPVTFCFHLNQYQNNSPGTYYVWDFGDGSDSIWDYNDPYIYDSICHTYITSSCGLPGNKFIVSVTAHNECDSSTASINNVRVLELPYADFSVPQYSCVNQNVLFNNTSIHGYGTNCNTNNAFLWKFGDGSTSTLNSPTHTYTTPGNYEITLIVSNTPCGADSIKKNICINPLPVANFTANSTSFCAPDTVSFTNLSGASDFCGNTVYTWSITCVNNNCCNQGCGGYNFTNGTNSDSFNPEINFTQPGIFTVTLTVDNGCNPPATHSETITVKAKPCATITGVPNAPCMGQSITPGVTFDICYGGNISYSWTATGSMNFPNPNSQNPGTIAYNSQSQQTIELQITNECGTTTADTTFNVISLPSSQPYADKDTICAGDTVILTSSGVLSGFTWSPSDSIYSGHDTVWVTPQVTTTYTLVVGSSPCSATGSIIIHVIPPPQLSFNPTNTAICAGDTVLLTVSGADSYTWTSGPDSLNPTQDTAWVHPSNTTTYTVTGGDISTNCSATANITVNVNPLPNAGGNLTICSTDLPYNLAGTPSGLIWSCSNPCINSGGMVSNGCNIGNYTVSYTNTSTGCFDTMNLSIILPDTAHGGNDFECCVNDAPIALPVSVGIWQCPSCPSSTISNVNIFNPDIAGPGPHELILGYNNCLYNDTIQVLVKPAPALTLDNYTICDGDAITITAQVQEPVNYLWYDNSTVSSITVYPNITTAYTVTVTNQATGCTSSAASTVTVNPTPSAAFILDTLACIGQNISLSAPSNLPNTNCSWYIDSNFFSASCTTSHNFTTTGIHTVQLIVQLGNCQDTVTKSIEIIAPPVPSFTTSLDPANGCAPNTVTFTNNTPTSNYYINYCHWDFGNGNSDTLFNPPSQIYQHGLYDITLSIGNMCDTLTVSNTITIHPWPVVDFGMLKTSVCAWEIDTFYFNVSGNPDYVIVNYGDGSLPDTITNYNNFYTHGFPYYGTNDTIYEIEAIGYNMCGTDTMRKTINVLPDTAIAFFAPEDSVVCAGDTVFFINNSTSGCTSYYWDFGDTASGSLNTSNQKNPSHIYDIAGTYTVMLAIDHPCWKDTMYRVIIVNPVTIANFSILSDSICDYNTLDLTNLTQPAPFQFLWDFGDGNTDDINSNPSHVYGSAGPYNVTLYIENNYGCIDSLAQPITVIYTPDAYFTAAPDTGCTDLDVDFNRDPSPYNYFLVLNPLNPSPIPIYNSNFQHTFTNPNNYTDTTYNIYLIANNTVNNIVCADTSFMSINVYPKPLADFNFNDSICDYGTMFFSDLSQGLGLDSFYWHFDDPGAGDDSISYLKNPSHYFPASGIYPITHALANNYNCTDTLVKDAHIAYTPVASFIPNHDTSGCSELEITFTINPYSLSDSYTWMGLSAVPGHIQVDTFINPNLYTDTIYPVTLIAQNANCVDTFSIDITVHPTPDADFDFYNNICETDTLTFNNLTNGINYYYWNFGDTNSTENTSNDVTPKHRFSNEGIYQVSLMAENDFGCIDSIKYPVTVHYTPDANFTATPYDSCATLSVTFLNQSDHLSANDYFWVLNGGTLSTSQDFQQTFFNSGYTNTDTINVTLIAINPQQPACKDSLSRQVFVRPNPKSEFTTSNNLLCTFGAPTQIDFVQQSIGAALFKWYVNNIQVGTDSAINYTFSDSSIYTISLVSINEYGCKDSTDTTFMVYHNWEAGIDFTPTKGCEPLNVLFMKTVDSLTYRWTFGDNTPVLTQPDGQNYFTHTYAGAGIYSVYVHVTGIGNCTDSITYTDTITVSNTARANFDFENILLPPPNDGTVNFTNTSGFADFFEWDFGDGSTYTGRDTLHRYSYNGCFDVNLYANNTYTFSDTVYHCPHDTTKRVCVDFFYGLYLPNAVCPNCVGDEISQFIPKAVGLKVFHLQIFDKWNNLVWETRSLNEHGAPNEFFKGYALDGTELPLGAYKWVVVDAMFENGKSWDGMSYKENGKLKRFGNLLIIKK